MRHLRRQIAVALVTVGLTLGLTAGPAAADNGPRQTNYVAALLYSALNADASPPGANDWNCRPGARHPHPVVLVHGTAENRYTTWSELAPRLARDGYCVFALNYSDMMATPFRGMGDIVNSAYQLQHFVDRVIRATGAREVDIVGHSQGGMMPRYYLQRLNGSRYVHRLIGLAPSNYGTTLYGVLPLVASLPGGAAVFGAPCQSCVQQTVGSLFLDDLNRGDDTVPSVRYTTIVTTYDEVVVPYSNAFLHDGGLRNITLQKVCTDDHTDHLGVPYDPIAIRLVRNALDPAHAKRPTCRFVPPVVG
ncbi:MAG TPA: alpha/beta fold hydrolase [Nocardioidaceae bacterium]|nr:alpha/beta fold hydrolase [Nocardioidaceae bacterium]